LPQTKTGRWSQDLPTWLQDRFSRAQQDPELLALKRDIWLLDSRTSQLVASLETGETALIWKTLRTTLEQFNDAERAASDRSITDEARAKHIEKMRLSMSALKRLITEGAEATDHWNEITKLIGQRKALVESERKRVVEMQQTLTTEQAMLLVVSIVDIVRRHVSDRSILAAISQDVGKLTAGDSSSGALEPDVDEA
jgi:hypothetical protein